LPGFSAAFFIAILFRFCVPLVQLSTASPASSENGEDERGDESALLRQIRQLQDLKKMVIQNCQAEGVQYHAGCTASVVYKHGNKLYVANAGDSRGVLCRGGESPFRLYFDEFSVLDVLASMDDQGSSSHKSWNGMVAFFSIEGHKPRNVN
jgi:serine/threonine protein phosphatase PrpC